MKKSEIYRKAAQAVMTDRLLSLTTDERLAVIQQLAEDEKLALFCEREEAAK